MQRRDFLRGSVTAGAAFALHHSRLWAQSSDAHVEILVNEPVGTISPNIYGHFTEHIGESFTTVLGKGQTPKFRINMVSEPLFLID